MLTASTDNSEMETVNNESAVNLSNSILDESQLPFIKMEEIIKSAQEEHDSLHKEDEENFITKIDLAAMQGHILQKLTVVYNEKLRQFFMNEFDDKLEKLVDVAIKEMAMNSSTYNKSCHDTSYNCTMETRIASLEDEVVRINRELDKLNTIKEGLENRMEGQEEMFAQKSILARNLQNENEQLKRKNKILQEQADEKLAQQIQTEEHRKANESLMQRITNVEETNAKIVVAQDALEQYGRLDILKIKGIPTPPKYVKEDTTDVAVDFLDRFLNLNVSKYDISVSHRQYIHAEKKKEGQNYIAPIYVKFVNRALVQKILARKHLLKKANEVTGLNLSVEENLTLTRRKILERAEKELPNYQFKWVKNGKVFIRKNHHSKPLKLIDEKTLDFLIAQEAPSPLENTKPEESNLPPTSALTPEVARRHSKTVYARSRLGSYASILQSTPVSIPPFPFKHTFHPTAINEVYKFKSKILTNLNSSVSL